jgi:alpha-methylacyl-CoA racemase
MSKNLNVVEFASLGPGPFCAMLLSANGAKITRIERPGEGDLGIKFNAEDFMVKQRDRVVTLDLKSDHGRETALALCKAADVVVEGFRPGVLERLGLGPDLLLAANPKLVVARLTGYGQTGPKAHNPGHDINYLAETGALYSFGQAKLPPPPPLSLVADFGGGGMYAAFSIMVAAFEARETGKGAVLDIAMQDGVTLMMAMTYSLINSGAWKEARESNVLDGAAPFYRCYETSDGHFIAVGAIENRFYRAFLRVLGVEDDPLFLSQFDAEKWPEMSRKAAHLIKMQTMRYWCEAEDSAQACISPVLSPSEAAQSGINRRLGMVDGKLVLDV